jgi:hypothetical protein
MTQARLDSGRECEHKVNEAQRLEDFKVPASINNHVRAAGLQLLKRNRLPRLAGEARAPPCWQTGGRGCN